MLYYSCYLKSSKNGNIKMKLPNIASQILYPVKVVSIYCHQIDTIVKIKIVWFSIA